MSSSRQQTIEETQRRFRALIGSGRFVVEANYILSEGIGSLREEKNHANHEAILAGTAILLISYTQFHRGIRNKSSFSENEFNQEYGTRGLYPLPYLQLMDKLKIKKIDANAILTVGQAALAKKIPFNKENFAGCGIYNTKINEMQTTSGGHFYLRLYRQQEKNRQWRKIKRGVLVALSAIPFVFPAYFAYQWMKRKNAEDQFSRRYDEIQRFQLSQAEYEDYRKNKQARRNFKEGDNSLKIDFTKYQVTDKPKKYVFEDANGDVNIYTDYNQGLRFKLFRQDLSQDKEGDMASDLLRILPATSCLTLRHR